MSQKSNGTKWFLFIIGLAILIRIILNGYIFKLGYFYGEDSDSFWRLGLSWEWSIKPFLFKYYWLPFQFLLNGLTFWVLRPISNVSTMLVPVIWNHIFFAASIAFLYMISHKLGGRIAGFAAVLIATILTEDVWTTFSGLSEPLSVTCALAVGYLLILYFDSKSHKPRYLILGVCIATGISSANHYLGWSLLPIAIGLIGYHLFIEWKNTKNVRSFLDPTIILSLLIAIGFPTMWITGNYFVHGDPFYFLKSAQAFHPWVTQISFSSRLVSVPVGLWKAAPTLFLTAGFSIPIVSWKKPKLLIILIPAATYLGFLTISAINAFGVPDMHNRYALIPVWLSLPFIGVLISRLITSKRMLNIFIGFGLGAILVFLNFSKLSNFTNYVDNTSRELISILQEHINSGDENVQVFMEEEACLYPFVGIVNSLPRPDRIKYLSTSDILHGEGLRQLENSSDLVILTNPLSKAFFGDKLTQIQTIGDFLVAQLSDTGDLGQSSASLPESWQFLSDDAFQTITDDGTIYYGFNPAPGKIGDAVGLYTSLDVPPNSCYIIHVDVQDRINLDTNPWVVLQQLIVNDVVLWSHDIAGNRMCGWQNVGVYLQPTTTRLEIQLRTVALSGPDNPVEWDIISLTGVRNLNISKCP